MIRDTGNSMLYNACSRNKPKNRPFFLNIINVTVDNIKNISVIITLTRRITMQFIAKIRYFHIEHALNYNRTTIYETTDA